MEEALSAPAAFEAPLLGGLAALWDLLKLKLRRRRLTDSEEDVIEWITCCGREFGAQLLQAQDREDLLARVDELAEQPRFNQLALLVRSKLIALPPLQEDKVSFEPSAEERDVFGDGVAQRLQLGLRSSLVLTQAVHRVLRHTTEEQRAEILAAGTKGYDWIYDPSVPVEAAEILLGALRAGAVQYAIVHALLQGRRLAPWLALALTDLFVDGLHGHLRLIAAVPGTEVPETLVPVSERLDLADLERRNVNLGKAAEELFAQAVASGQSVYPPLEADGD